MVVARHHRAVSRERAKTASPRHAGCDVGVREGVGSLLDRLPQFGEGLAHVGGHRPGGLGDEPGDVAGGRGSAAAHGACVGEPCDAAADQSGDVVGVVESSGTDDGGEHGLRAVPVRLDTADLGDERPVGVAGERVVEQRLGQACAGEQGRDMFGLRGLRDGLVLVAQVWDRGPDILFGGDGLVRRLLGALVADHAVEDRVDGRLLVVLLVAFEVRLVGGDVGDVASSAAGHRDVEALPSHRGGVHDRVRRVHGRSLRPVHRERVAQVDAVGHVGGRQDDAAGEPGIRAPHRHRPVLVGGGHPPAVAVLHPAPPGAEPAVVLPGDDQIPLTRLVPVAQQHPARGDLAREDQVAAGPRVEAGDDVEGLGDQDARAPGGTIRAPRLVGGIQHVLEVPAHQALVLVVGGQDVGVPKPKPQGRGLLPTGGEAADIGQLWGVAAFACQEPERAARVDARQLRPVADQQQLCPALGGVRGKLVECERPSQGRLIHDEQLPRSEVPDAPVVLVQPLAGVLRRDSEVRGQHLGCRRRRCQASHATGSVRGLPGPAQRTERRRLARAGRTDEQVHDPAGDGDLLHDAALIGREHDTARAAHADSPSNRGQVDRRRRRVGSKPEEAILGVQQRRRGEHRVVAGTKRAAAVGAGERRRCVDQFRRGQPQRGSLGGVDDEADDRFPVLG